MIRREVRMNGVQFYTSDTPQDVTAVLEIDEDRILKQLAPKATRNRSRKAAVLSGAVRVKVYPVTK